MTSSAAGNSTSPVSILRSPSIPDHSHRRRRSSTVLNPRDFVQPDLWAQAPVLTGTTKFAPLENVKNIMVTGGAGFMYGIQPNPAGSLCACWFIRHLALTYPSYTLVSFDKLDYCATLNNTRSLDSLPNFHFVHGDITSPASVKRCLRQYSIDTIVHFAAQSHVDLSFGNSYAFTRTNVYGTHVLLEAARASNIRRFIHISTDEVYGDVPPESSDLLETSLLAPTNPYAASKAAAEMLVNAYWKSFKLPVIIVRSNNAYGPHQFPEKIIPKFILLLQRGEKLLLHGDGTPTRRYLYAADVGDALDTIFHRGELGQVYNIASKDEVSNLDIARNILALFGLTHENSSIALSSDVGAASLSGQSDESLPLNRYIEYTEDRPFNDHRYATDGSKLAALGWTQNTPFEVGLRITVEWYRRFGEVWWGDISRILTPFPVTRGNEIFTKEEFENEWEFDEEEEEQREEDREMEEERAVIDE